MLSLLPSPPPAVQLLVHGTKEGTEKLQQECASECACEVLAPERMQTVDLTADLATAKVGAHGRRPRTVPGAPRLVASGRRRLLRGLALLCAATW